MREIRLSGSEGGGNGTTRSSLPLSLCRPSGPVQVPTRTHIGNSWIVLVDCYVTSSTVCSLLRVGSADPRFGRGPRLVHGPKKAL